MIPPNGKCPCCTCKGIHCLLPHPGHNLHLPSDGVWSPEQETIDLLLDLFKDEKKGPRHQWLSTHTPSSGSASVALKS